MMRQQKFAQLEARRNTRHNNRKHQDQLKRSQQDNSFAYRSDSNKPAKYVEYEEDYRDEKQDDIENNWRQSAQMISSEDELDLVDEAAAAAALDEYRRDREDSTRLLSYSTSAARRTRNRSSSSPSSANLRVNLDKFPVSKSKQVSKAKYQKQKQQQQPVARRKLVSPVSGNSPSPLMMRSSSHEQSQNYINNEQQQDELARLQHHNEDGDDDSSISFAQSGCHSILSAWRIKSANRKAAAAAAAAAAHSSQQPRPTSVLSQASSGGRKSVASTAFTALSRGKSPASQTRIALGPKQAQQFVTNTRRRRRANELILSTLEARRQALALNRQNLANSIWGSESYLADALAAELSYAVEPEEQQLISRLSLSPSPAQLANRLSPSPLVGQRSPSPLVSGSNRAVGSHSSPLKPRAAHSDLGSRQEANAQRQRRLAADGQRAMGSSPVSPAASKLSITNTNTRLPSLTTSASSRSAQQRPTYHHHHLYQQRATGRQHQVKSPPIAKLDQNSSDLCSSNLSSDDSSSTSSSSSGSQFTQLVTSELAPDCVLLDEQPLRSRPTTNRRQAPSAALHQLERDYVEAAQAPKAPKRQRRRQPIAGATTGQGGSTEASAGALPAPDEGSLSDQGSKLRRGALKRDSIRRLRLNRSQQASDSMSQADEQRAAAAERKSSSSDSTSSQQHQYRTKLVVRPRTLAPERRQLIEENPFLNRHHFRSSSMRTSDGASLGAASPTGLCEKPAVAPRVGRARLEETRGENELGGRQRPQQSGERTSAEVKQVERALRQLKPNQVFASYSSESRVVKSQSSSLSGAPRSCNEELASSSSTTTTNTRHDVIDANRKRVNSNERKHSQRESPTPTSGANHNQQHRVPVSVNKRLVSERFELMRTSSISPPPEFSDHNKGSVDRATGAKVSPKAPTYSTVRQQPAQQSPLNQRPVERKLTPAIGVAPTFRRSLSEERRPTRRLAPLQENNRECELPKFEDSADDEFRKRVDYLRRLARANLSDEPLETRPRVASQSAAAAAAPEVAASTDTIGRRSVAPTSATKRPMTTDWKGEPAAAVGAAAESSRASDLSATGQRRAPLAPNPRPSMTSPVPAEVSDRLFNDRLWRTEPLTGGGGVDQRGASKRLATTNLDLLADRYQQRPTGADLLRAASSRWGRSNSSLASLTSAPIEPSKLAMAQQRRVASPVPRSDLGLATDFMAKSQPKQQLTSSAVVKLVVREKSAPKLDFAVVETTKRQQHPDLTQHNQSQSQSQPQPPTRQSVPRVKPLVAERSQASRSSDEATAPVKQQVMRAPLRVTSPRSPDFGPTAASSNDDSAIASSVSSPSLSYTVNQQQHTGSPPRRPPEGVLQSILRRQQQQQQQQQLSSDSSDNSPLRAGSSAPSAPVPLANMMPEEPLVRSDARSPIRRPISADLEPARAGDQQASGAGSQLGAAPKRVHFNDKASIRSFESISSLNSNSTAVPSEMLRQQIGSPDSMGSGSTSRLSGESPELRKDSVAAIYAVRGDPELELQHQPHNQPQLVHSLGPRPAAYQPIVGPSQQAIAAHHHQPMLGSGYLVSSAPTSRLQPMVPQHQFIRMTAPPTISTRSGQQQAPLSPLSPLAPPTQYLVRPTSSTSTQIIPTPALRPTYAQPVAALIAGYQVSPSHQFASVLPQLPAGTRRPVQLSPSGLPPPPPQLPPASQHQHPNGRADNLANYSTEV